MTTPRSDANRLPLRSFAFMLLSAAVVFIAIGVFVLRDANAEPDPQAGAPMVTTTTVAPTTTADPEPTDEPEPTTSLAPPPVPAVDVHVLNNSTVQGLAGRTADTLRASGWPVGAVGNYSASIVGGTTVYYGDAPGEQQVAERVAATLGASTAPRFPGISDQPPGVVVILAG
ncbi:LytR C-terminal domain-containing protein [Hoyosella sp. YIM 151337]|uniref:LytR C-terminal domain-containing protein n=1 Tax=Hoyosella sp. YIM 151337 TaxID=2992742 RepID=UPI0022355229|nr:LytR C-terminal domain-containing protein [Hoyosella sp. YIM 151337]MCW4351810.1 LytR C-terminal domain-containing protein [Hoyosella sp. YIM 151337]